MCCCISERSAHICEDARDFWVIVLRDSGNLGIGLFYSNTSSSLLFFRNMRVIMAFFLSLFQRSTRRASSARAFYSETTTGSVPKRDASRCRRRFTLPYRAASSGSWSQIWSTRSHRSTWTTEWCMRSTTRRGKSKLSFTPKICCILACACRNRAPTTRSTTWRKSTWTAERSTPKISSSSKATCCSSKT